MSYEEFEKSVIRALDDSEPCDLKALEELNGSRESMAIMPCKYYSEKEKLK